MKTLLRCLLGFALLVSFNTFAQQQTYRPFVLASSSAGELDGVTAQVVSALETAGFNVVGRYSPIADTHIIVVTNDDLLRAAASSDRGGYAAGQRVSVSQVGANVEVAFVNPLYIQHAYRLGSDMQGVRRQLDEALGMVAECGAGTKKMTEKKLRDFNYMMGMQKFDDPSELGEFSSYQEAIAAVETGLSREDDGLSLVYRIDIPGKEQTVFGVGMKSTGEEDENIDEAAQMNVVDFEGCRKHAYLPYEVLVDGNKVEALHMRFRMAVHFPNLSMMGKHGFTKLMPFPGAIEDSLESLVNNKP